VVGRTEVRFRELAAHALSALRSVTDAQPQALVA
jgi:hypothetical protein